MNKTKHDVALRRKIGGSKVFKKRTFRGNRYSKCFDSVTKSSDLSVTASRLQSTSAKKIYTKNNVCNNINSNSSIVMESDGNEELVLDNDFLLSSNLVIDSDILKSIINLLGTCPYCGNKSIEIKCDQSQKKGLSLLLNFVCNLETCNWSQSFYTSKRVNQTHGRGNQPFEINNRAIIAMREIGRGHTALKTFCGFMNIQPPMQTKAFNEMQQNIASVYQDVANDSMQRASDELRTMADEESVEKDEVTDIVVSCDGTWQRRGFSSLNGVVTVIASDTGKCVDYRVKSKQCASCTSWESRKSTESELYEQFISTHDCHINHEGSAGAMEVSGLVECFMESEKNRRLRYTSYIGDGDTKSYSEIVKRDPYPGIVVQKLECVGHIQKRVGGRLRKLKSSDKAPLSDGKSLSGKGRLTEKMMNKLQNYFGIAVRQCTGTTIYHLKKAIGAVLYHCSDANNLDTRHQFCPRRSDSWCQFQADKCNGTSLYKEKPGLPIAIRDKIRPVFLDLSDENLLSKCLHGKTQNNNESINNVIWKRCPKDIYVGRKTLECGVASAVICFNDGLSGVLNVFKKLEIPCGTYTTKFCMGRDDDRISVMERKSSDNVKSRRKELHAKKKGFIDANEDKEGTVYGAGLF